MMLEKIFKSDKDLLKKAKKMARVVDQAYGTPDERHKGNRHCYFIMFPTEIPPKNLKEFVGLAVYGGREDAVVRETSHNVSNEEVSTFYSCIFFNCFLESRVASFP